MKTNFYLLIFLVSVGCKGQVSNINRIIENSILIDLPLDYSKISNFKGDSLIGNFKDELSISQYYLNIENKNILNKSLSFQNSCLLGKINLSSKYNIAIIRRNYNVNDAVYYLCSFSEKGKLLSALIIFDRSYIPSVSSTINLEKNIYIKEEYEDHTDNYTFILQEDGIFKRICYSEEKL